MSILVKILGDASQFKSSLRSAQGTANLFGSALRAVFRTAVVAGFFMAVRAGIQSFQQAISLVKKTTSSMMALNEAGVRTAAILSKGGEGFQEAFNAATQQARELSTQSGYTAKQIQDGFLIAAIAGYEAETAFEVAKKSMMMAQTAGTSFSNAIEGNISIINAFKFSMQELPQVADVITAAWSQSKTTLDGFYKSMQFVGSAAAVVFGETMQTFIDASASIMTMNQAGLNASRSGVYLRSAMLKLNSATSKVSTMLAKYKVNVYQAGAGNQKFIPTITAAQEELGNLTDELIVLKNNQLEIAGSQGVMTGAFEEASKKVSLITGKIEELKKGLGDINQEFLLSGGKMRPWGEILKEMAAKIPAETVQKNFGIRSGQGIGLLMNQIKLFEKYQKMLEEANKRSKIGDSITSELFVNMMQAFKIKWQQIQHSITAGFNVVGDSAFEAFTPLMDKIVNGFQKGYELIEAWKPLFKDIFSVLTTQLFSPIEDFFTKIQSHLLKFPFMLRELPADFSLTYGEGGSARPQTAVMAELSTLPISPKGLSAWSHELLTVFSDALQPIVDILKPIFGEAVSFLVDALIIKLSLQTDLFMSLGEYIAEGFIRGVIGFLGTKTAKSISDKLMTPFGEQPFGVPAIKTAFDIINPLAYMGTLGELVGSTQSGINPLTFLKEKFNSIVESLTDTTHVDALEESVSKLDSPKNTMSNLTRVIDKLAVNTSNFNKDLAGIERRLNGIEKLGSE